MVCDITSFQDINVFLLLIFILWYLAKIYVNINVNVILIVLKNKDTYRNTEQEYQYFIPLFSKLENKYVEKIKSGKGLLDYNNKSKDFINIF